MILLPIVIAGFSGTYHRTDSPVKGSFSDPRDLLNQDFMEVEKLQDAGINSADIQKLKGNGITTVRVCSLA